MLDQRSLLAGYAAAQAMPGPLFTLASFIGADAFGRTLGWGGALLATCANFVPSFFLLTIAAPFYRSLAKNPLFRRALAAFAAITYASAPPWVVVILGALAGFLLGRYHAPYSYR